MCTTCGCSDGAHTTIIDPVSGAHTHLGLEPEHEHSHAHGHDHSHTHEHGAPPHATRTIEFEQQLLAKNDRLAERNRGWLAAREVVAVNLMSSPGAGKTTLLERTIRDLGGEVPIAVVEGDQETLLDSERIRATGAPVVQINTGAGCHLDAEMLAGGLRTLDPAAGTVLLVENVGNLVCPALFDLGEQGKVVIISVTEGADKPLKYPHMFRAADLMIVNKIDLAPHVDFDVAQCIEWAQQVHPGIESLQLSATRGDGLDAWYVWLRSRAAVKAR
ncbi:MAG: hydrogenase nickel incorporation protein HypB [Candidatus Dormiibacterota bacterium]